MPEPHVKNLRDPNICLFCGEPWQGHDETECVRKTENWELTGLRSLMKAEHDGHVARHLRHVQSYIPVSDELAADMVDLRESINRQSRFLAGTDTDEDRRVEEELRVRREQVAADARARRFDQRACSEWQPLTKKRLLTRLGIGPTFAQHLVQEYCTCDHNEGGWAFCQHALDLNLKENL